MAWRPVSGRLPARNGQTRLARERPHDEHEETFDASVQAIHASSMYWWPRPMMIAVGVARDVCATRAPA